MSAAAASSPPETEAAKAAPASEPPAETNETPAASSSAGAASSNQAPPSGGASAASGYPSRRVTIGGSTQATSAATAGTPIDPPATGNTNSNSNSAPPATTANNNIKNEGGMNPTGTSNPNTNVPNVLNNNPQQHQQQSVPPPVTMGQQSTMESMRRGSLSSAGFMDDPFFARRPSLGFDMPMDAFGGGRRDSMDSSAAALDAALMDLNRRRFSMANDFNAFPGSNMPGAAAAAAMPVSSGNSSGSNTHESITHRQQQLQQQQRELEQRQKELEFQRQQLIASMQERSYAAPPPSMHHHHRGSLGMSGSLGLGSVHSHGSGSQQGQPGPQQQQPPHHPQQHRASNGSAGSGGSQHWWICQVCNSKAFASHEEAMTHEATCQEGRGGKMTSDPMHPLPMQHQQQQGPPEMMSQRGSFPMGGGSMMDSSQRGMSMGMGGGATMDNSARGVVSIMDSSRGGGGSLGLDSSRNMSLGMDSSSGQSSYHQDRAMSVGPFAMLQQPMPLSMLSDKDWLTPLHCFVRRHCVEVFTATDSDVATPSKGKRKPIQVGQIGIRCPHCHAFDSTGNSKARERGSVYYPTTISSIYNATMNLLQRHLHNCPAVPDDIMRRYETLKADDARSGTSKRYWIESALSLGLVDTPNGIRHSALRPPPLPSLTRQQETTGQTRRNSNEFFSTKSNANNEVDTETTGDSPKTGATGATPLVTADDKPYATNFSFHLLSQMQPCVFTEADRLGKRKGLPPGFPGLACRHCFGGYGSGRFFPSSIKTLSDTSKTLNVLHNHMMRCRKCPADVKEKLEKLRGSHDEERAKMKFGSQKAFFARIWECLHGKDHPGSLKRAVANRNKAAQGRQQQQQQQHMQHHQQQQQQQQHRMMVPHQQAMPGYGYHPQMQVQQHMMQPPHTQQLSPPNSGLDALAAVSSPPKRQKTS